MSHNILVVRFSSLGDIVLTEPLYPKLKSVWPDCRISVAVKEKYVSVLEDNPYLDHVLVLGESESIFSFAERVRRQKFDILIDLHDNLRSNLLSWLSNIPRRVRYKKAALHRRLFVTRRISHPELQRRVVDRYLDTLTALGAKPAGGASPKADASRRPAILHASVRDFSKILVVQTAFLGDAVLTLPMFQAIKLKYPDSKIDVLCTPEIREIFADNPHINELLVMDKRNADRGISALGQWSRKIRGKYSVALVPHRSFRSALLIWLSGIPRRVGFDNSQGKWFFTDRVTFDWEMHDSERNLKLLEVIGVKSARPVFQLAMSGSQETFNAFLKEQGIPSVAKIVGMNPGAMWNTKRWLPEGFAKVADSLIKEHQCSVILFGSGKDKPIIQSVISAMSGKAVNLAGKTDLRTLSFLISKCSLFVTNDSGPMHLACASGVPVVAVFGPTTRELGFFPYGEKSAVVELDMACRPCSLHGGNVCPLTHFKCMRDITPEMVLAPCRKFLSESVSKV